ncbi:cob(I)yrinic acid a,c-diamide adenosyltransferase [Pseudalkalibacillus salsuginis]|uniref:cob(I)yrinic acid a,c-diamide adenosyltransferase n=1 Tax=Pseudalkalibacillus salsuginis TaxID=2910972 RepID=UPI001F1D6266|nr:cob(I)yrinic acid a,c-diamide adenosyltransferase [Pseudalkalibacillus salsuginis]MCF6412015.1 cob(I)yrinic acid a,c-diamide adenosyltransferase [Pseudalkalibacillus salsuginis]
MKIYTKSGDKGTTSLVYGERVGKNDPRVEAYGTCDEANSMIGLGLSHLQEPQREWKVEFEKNVRKVQTVLFHVGAELATPAGKKVGWTLEESDITYLEQAIDRWDKELKPLKQFVLPGGSAAASVFHVARTVVRRAERQAVAIENVNPLVLSYLNRLSDFLFVAARYLNQKMNVAEPILHDEE